MLLKSLTPSLMLSRLFEDIVFPKLLDDMQSNLLLMLTHCLKGHIQSREGVPLLVAKHTSVASTLSHLSWLARRNHVFLRG